VAVVVFRAAAAVEAAVAGGKIRDGANLVNKFMVEQSNGAVVLGNCLRAYDCKTHR
jgi:hypothetical protein